MTYERQYGRDDVDYHSWYSDWSKLMAKTYTLPELQRIAGVASSEATRAAGTHLRAIERTASMQGNSMARAHSRNVVGAAGDKARAARGAIEIHELFPEHALQRDPASQLSKSTAVTGEKVRPNPALKAIAHRDGGNSDQCIDAERKEDTHGV